MINVMTIPMYPAYKNATGMARIPVPNAPFNKCINVSQLLKLYKNIIVNLKKKIDMYIVYILSYK